MSREAVYVSDPTMPIWLIVVLILGLVCIAVRGAINPAQTARGGRWGLGSLLLFGFVVMLLIRGITNHYSSYRVDVSWNASASSPRFVIPKDPLSRRGDAVGESRHPAEGFAPQPVPAQNINLSSNAAETASVTPSTLADRGVPVRVVDQPPFWLETPSIINAQQATLPVSSQWFATEDEAIEQTKTRAWDFVRQTFRDRLNVALPETPPLDLLIDKGMVADFQLERVLKDFGNNLKEPMFRAHARLNFNTTQASPLYQQWLAHVRSANLWRLGIAVISATFCLGFFGQCLRWNHATGGRYRRRLIAASTAIAMSAAAVAVWLPTWIRA